MENTVYAKVKLNTDWIIPCTGGIILKKIEMDQECPLCNNIHNDIFEVFEKKKFFGLIGHYYIICPETKKELFIKWG